MHLANFLVGTERRRSNEVSTERFTELARKGWKRPSWPFLKIVPHFLYQKREAGLTTLPDATAAHAYGAAIRSEALNRLPELLEEFEKKAIANGQRFFGPVPHKRQRIYRNPGQGAGCKIGDQGEVHGYGGDRAE